MRSSVLSDATICQIHTRTTHLHTTEMQEYKASDSLSKRTVNNIRHRHEKNERFDSHYD